MLRFNGLIAILVLSPAYGGWIPLTAGEFEAKYGVSYVERATGSLKADTYVPKDPGPHPGVLVVHGGAWRMGSRAQLSGIAQQLAQQGFSAVAISYRLAPQDKFPAQIEDCKAAVRWMRIHAEELKLDPDHIGGFGYSAGAHLVTLLGTTDMQDGLEGVEDPDHQPSTRLQAVVGGGTPCDFRDMPTDLRWLSFWLGGTRGEMAEQYRLASPASFVTSDDPPMFFFHGENDDLVPITQPQGMCQIMQQAHVPAELYVVPKLGHIAAVMDHTALSKCIAFLNTQLKRQESP
ncbi:alpha/beta hydrolase [Bythopirellula polymerisocia]|uniref:Carboxylesterase NlhH n=1 Tax=Bythopirellula polymerisocia TaxID=2528003 RepID=A0A5C6CXG5_9BACT|nr:alpha/beta hydrolase [Bythopirellula polymerisocia]TWU29292.1 Carboxylesterase NlhH [Bythopirellula polymerisocia]